ncbi:MAG: hypothetical protein J0J15_35045, partial [Mesorhizobium sp.]|nr:hypothetical protein [Mesorhizobium sp.]
MESAKRLSDDIMLYAFDRELLLQLVAQGSQLGEGRVRIEARRALLARLALEGRLAAGAAALAFLSALPVRPAVAPLVTFALWLAAAPLAVLLVRPRLELAAVETRLAGAVALVAASLLGRPGTGLPARCIGLGLACRLARARTIVTAVVAMARTLVVETGLPPKKDRLGFFGFGRGFGRGRTRGSLFLAGSASVVGTGCIVGAINHASFALRLGLSHRGGGGSLGRLLWSHVLWSIFFRDFSLGLFLRRGFHRCFGDRLRRAFGRSPGRLHFSGSGLRA